MATHHEWRVRVALGTLLLAPPVLAAQGTVSGQLTLLEKPGASSTDLESAVIYLLPAKAPREKPKKTHVTITMHDRGFAPHVVVMTAGSKVRFENQDPFDHNAFTNAPSGTFDFGLSDRGSTVEEKLINPGVYPVFCNIHARMSAFVIVVATTYFALAGSDGSFTIPGVPAGQYTLVWWHQRGGEKQQKVVVEALGMSNVALQLDARGFRAKEHKNKFGEDYKSDTGDRY